MPILAAPAAILSTIAAIGSAVSSGIQASRKPPEAKIINPPQVKETVQAVTNERLKATQRAASGFRSTLLSNQLADYSNPVLKTNLGG